MTSVPQSPTPPIAESSDAMAREHWQAEMASAWLYRIVAATESDLTKRSMFESLAEQAEAQALIWQRQASDGDTFTYWPSMRALLVARLTRALGPRAAKPLLAAMKVRGLAVYGAPQPSADHSETHHGARSRAGTLRAVVFGINDGLISNTSLLMGMAGAAVPNQTLLITGAAGLLAGALSMASGEYVSVRAQRDTYSRQMQMEREELATYPQAEVDELATIYRARGLADADAERLASRILSDPDAALRTLAREELGIDPDDLGSPWTAAGSSFAAFALGAALPLLPLLMMPAKTAITVSAVVAGLALAVVGACVALFTGESSWKSAGRMLAIGAAAAGATFLIGRLFGVALN
jgi:vacuolar iron transporter family protein